MVEIASIGRSIPVMCEKSINIKEKGPRPSMTEVTEESDDTSAK